MKTYELEKTQIIDRPLEEVFAFFADARNLAVLTPGWLKFEIRTKGPIQMAPGARIDYRIKLRGIPMWWQSEITVWDPPRRFVDEQRRGPYRSWVHTHTFEAVDPGRTRVRDHVRYSVPGGAVVHRLFVAPDIERIFSFRAQKLEEIFRRGGGRSDP